MLIKIVEGGAARWRRASTAAEASSTGTTGLTSLRTGTKPGPNRNAGAPTARYPRLATGSALRDVGGARAAAAQPLAGRPAEGPFGGGASPVEQVMADTVRTGYEVIEENIRHGRQAAERLRLGTYRSEDLPDDMAMVVNRLLRLGMDLSTTWFQLIAAVLRDPRLATAFESTGGGSTAAARPPARSTVRRPPRIHYRVRCSRPYDIEFIPHELSGPTLPVVAGLYAPDRGASPIHVRFEREINGGLAIVTDVPDDQPPATYSGAVIDRDTHEPIGTLRLKIDP